MILLFNMEYGYFCWCSNVYSHSINILIFVVGGINKFINSTIRSSIYFIIRIYLKINILEDNQAIKILQNW